MGEIPWGVGGEAVWIWLDENNTLDVLIVENYRIRPEPMTKGRANVWSESHESQIIGGARMAASLFGFEIVIQEPDRKPAGYGYAGLQYVAGKKGTHMQDAVAHGAYWWMEVGRKRES